MTRFHLQTVLTSQFIQKNVFLVLCLSIWWRHKVWITKNLKFDFLENEKNFWTEIKNIFLSFTSVLLDVLLSVKHVPGKSFLGSWSKNFPVVLRNFSRFSIKKLAFHNKMAWSWYWRFEYISVTIIMLTDISVKITPTIAVALKVSGISFCYFCGTNSRSSFNIEHFGKDT